MRYRL